MPGKKKIFISHSAHEDIDEQFMDTLICRLEQEGFQVYCDRKRLEVGDRWRNELYSAIGCCHAAIVLITKQALNIRKYPWVFKECSMFIILKWLKKDFPIIPIRMTGVDIKDIKKSQFEVLNIDEIMAGSVENVEPIVVSIKKKLSNIECIDKNEPLYFQHKRITSRIIDVNTHLLRDAIDRIDSELDHWDPIDKELPYRLARILLTLNPKQVIDALQYIFPCLKEEESKNLIYLLAPFWLDLPAIARLEDTAQNEQDEIQEKVADFAKTGIKTRTAFGLNAREQLTAGMHVRRAGYLKETPYRIIMLPSDGGIDDEGRYARHIIAEMNSRADRFNRSDKSIDKFIIRQAIKKPIFIIVPLDTAKKVVQGLRMRFWPFIFVVLTGQNNSLKWKHSELKMLKPPLKRGSEDHICELFWDTISEITDIIRCN